MTLLGAVAAVLLPAVCGAGPAAADAAADRYLRKGMGAWMQRRLPDALAQFQLAVAEAPEDASCRHFLGMALRHLGRLEEAITQHRVAIFLEPLQGAYHYDLGLALRANGQLDEAIAAFRRAVEFAPREMPAWFDLALTLERRGLLGDAVAAYRRTVALAPRQPRYRQALQAAEARWRAAR